MTWITASGEVEPNTQSNLLPEDAPRGPKIETSMHAEVIYRDGKSTYTDHTPQEVQMDQGMNTDNGILESARTEGGGLIHGRSVRPTDQVMLPGGMPTSAKVAADMGFLQRNPDGSFSDVQEIPETASEKAAAEVNTNDASAEFTIGDEAEAAMTQIVEAGDQGAALAALSETLQLGGVSESTLARIATAQGIEPDQAADLIGTAHAGFYGAASNHMEALGVTDGDAFQAFVQDNPQAYGKLTEGARALVMGQGTDGLDDVAGQFMERADRYMPEDVMEALDFAGFEHRSDGKGGLIVVTNDGAQVPFQVAVRQGIVRFSRS